MIYQCWMLHFRYVKIISLNGKFFLSQDCLQDAVHAYSGGLGNTLKMYDINSNTGIIMFSFLSSLFIHNVRIP